MSTTPDPAARTSAGCADRIGLLDPRYVIEVVERVQGKIKHWVSGS
jgi:hypothetical protein